MDYKKASLEFKKLVSKYRRVTIISHIRPDGDTISSALTLYNLFKEIGVTSELVCNDAYLPKEFAFLNGFDRFKQKISYDDSLVICVDCAVVNRCGFDLSSKEIVNIDHHQDNSNFGDLNIVSVEASTTLVLYKLIKEGFRITKNIAEAIYTGLISDSQNFTTSLTNQDSFDIARDLLNYNIDINFIANRVNRYKALSHIRLKAKAIDSMQLFVDGSVAIMVLTKEDLDSTGATYSNIHGIIDEAISLATVDIAILIVEYGNSLKVSLRSKNANVSNIARIFGGGGHKNASGFEVKDGNIINIKDRLLKIL